MTKLLMATHWHHLFKLLLIILPSLIISQQLNEPQHVVKYFKTNLTRQEILGTEIDAADATTINHFKATYDKKGRLISIEYVPSKTQTGKKKYISNEFQKPHEPFRYFEKWDPNLVKLSKEIPRSKTSDVPFYRATFYDSVRINTVEYMKNKKRLWTFYIKWDRSGEPAISVLYSVHRPITSLDPHLFNPMLSEMKPGWVADFKHNRLGKPLGAIIRDQLGNVYYFYKFKYRFITVGEDTLNQKNYRVTTSEYYRSDSTLVGSHQLTFTETGSLWKKEFYDATGALTESIEYIYNPKQDEVSILIRDPKGNILHRQVMSQ